MKTSKRILSIIMAALITVTAIPLGVFAYDGYSSDESGENFFFNFNEKKDTVTALSVNPYGNEIDSLGTVKWFGTDNTHYVFLPADADTSCMRVSFEAKTDVYVGGTKLENGECTDVFSEMGNYTLTCDGKDHSVIFMKSAELPAVYIQTESGSLNYIHASKDNKEPGNIRIYENGKQTLDIALKQIKGRGNSTWNLEKKPYNIKFDKKQNLFGMGKAKKWTLLASHYDSSLVRNNIAYTLADEFGLDFTSKMQYIDLYINGEYLGNYIICESVEVGETRVDIKDLDKENESANPDMDLDNAQKIVSGYGPGKRMWADIPNSPDDISGGYLLELDYTARLNEEISGFISNNGQALTLKSPELATKAEVDYIADYYQQAEDALLSYDGYNSLGKHYTDYIDLESAAKMYILEEFIENTDGGQTSAYIYKKENSDKFVVSPIWDCDACFANPVSWSEKITVDTKNPNMWFVNLLYYSRTDVSSQEQTLCDTFFTLLYQRHDDFREAVKKEWKNFCELLNDDKYNEINELCETLTASAVMNAYRWNIFSSKENYNDKAAAFKNESATVINFMKARTAGLSKGFGDNGCILYYDQNGGSGKIVDPNIYLAGERATVKSHLGTGSYYIEAPYGQTLNSWNTKPDASGTSYKPGDQIVLENGANVLFAIWSPCNCSCHKTGFQNFIFKIRLMFQKIFRLNKRCDCGVEHYKTWF